MKSGIVYPVESDSKLSDLRENVDLPDGHEYNYLLEAIEIQRDVELDSLETDAQIGKIAVERVVESDEVQISNDHISEYTTEQKTTLATGFLYHPGNFFVIENGSGKFATEVINAHTEVTVKDATINLDQFIQQKQNQDVEIDPWKVGFYGKRGLIENGVVHGDSVLDDDEIGGVLDITEKNQLGLDYEYQNLPLRMFVAESGYVEIYQPNDFTTAQFSEYLVNEIVPVLQKK